LPFCAGLQRIQVAAGVGIQEATHHDAVLRLSVSQERSLARRSPRVIPPTHPATILGAFG
jgi:hypothetical protein